LQARDGEYSGEVFSALTGMALFTAAMARDIPALLLVLLEQHGITGAAELDSFLADVRPLADTWLARQQLAAI
jgi:hypothetical protein